jgi:ADP-heptose:LPS heptosyltransferase
VLLGNAKDRLLCTDILLKLPEGRVKNLAGQTSLHELECTLRDVDFVVANDSGGMHLANFFGIPTVGLFGPTHPDWGGPFFDAPKCIVQSPTKSIADLSEATVFECINDWLKE